MPSQLRITEAGSSLELDILIVQPRSWTTCYSCDIYVDEISHGFEVPPKRHYLSDTCTGMRNFDGANLCTPKYIKQNFSQQNAPQNLLRSWPLKRLEKIKTSSDRLTWSRNRDSWIILMPRSFTNGETSPHFLGTNKRNDATVAIILCASQARTQWISFLWSTVTGT